MSSDDLNSTSTSPSTAPRGKPPNSVGQVALGLILLTGLIWAMAPGRAKYQPAPLRAMPAGCSQTTPDFVPTDVTEVPGVDLSAFSKAQQNHILFRLNMEPCPCGCNNSIAGCRINHPTCPLVKDLVEKITADESSATSQGPEAGSQK